MSIDPFVPGDNFKQEWIYFKDEKAFLYEKVWKHDKEKTFLHIIISREKAFLYEKVSKHDSCFLHINIYDHSSLWITSSFSINQGSKHRDHHISIIYY